MQDTQVQYLGREDPLEEGMAAHSSILAWRTPWTEKPGGLTVQGVAKSQTWLPFLSVFSLRIRRYGFKSSYGSFLSLSFLIHKMGIMILCHQLREELAQWDIKWACFPKPTMRPGLHCYPLIGPSALPRPLQCLDVFSVSILCVPRFCSPQQGIDSDSLGDCYPGCMYVWSVMSYSLQPHGV